MTKNNISYANILFLVATIFTINACDNNRNNYNCNKRVKKEVTNKRYSSADNTTKKKIIGRWKKILKHKNGTIVYVTTNFRNNGKFYTSAIKKLKNGKRVKLHSSGDWRVKNGYLIERTRSSNYANRNTTTKDKIILTTNSQLVYKTNSGKVFTYSRLK